MSKQLTNTGGAGFALQPQTMQEAFQMAEMLSGSQMVPKSYQGKPQDAMVAMMMGAELGLNPIQSLANVAVINGKPAIYGDALLALVQNHPSFGGHEESFCERTMTATCTVWRKGDKSKHAVTFSQADAQQAGLWGKPGPWSQYPKRMLMWRARGYALRDKFADALGGLVTVEEARDIPEKDITPQPQAETRGTDHLEVCPDDRWQKNRDAWHQALTGGQLDMERLEAMLASKGYRLTDAQKNWLTAVEVETETQSEEATES